MIETNVNWNHDARNYLHSAAHLRFNNTSRCVMSSSRASPNDTYLPGGTAMITQGKFSGRIISRGMDRLGSFTWMAIRGKKDIGVIAITAYRVCQRAGTKSGPDTAFTRQCIQMREEWDKNPDPRNKIFKNMNEILDEWMGKGFHPIVMIDSNSEITERNLNEFTERNGLHDIITTGREMEAPPSYARGKKRIDFLLGNDHVQRAVINSGALGLYDGLKASDHTMQYVDLDEKLLFQDDTFTPMPGFHREFKLHDVKRKNKFQETLQERYVHQNIAKRVTELATKMENATQIDEADIKAYNDLDDEIVELILSTANRVGRVDFGYQRSADLCIAGKTIRMHKAILSCIMNDIKYTESLELLATELNHQLPSRDEITVRQALTNVNDAWKAKRVVEKEDGERRAKWLEDICREIARETGQDADKTYQTMIKCALSKGMFKRLKAILKNEWSALDYIEIPNDKWYLDRELNELYEFDNGIFVAHSRFVENLFEEYGSIKVLPKGAVHWKPQPYNRPYKNC